MRRPRRRGCRVLGAGPGPAGSRSGLPGALPSRVRYQPRVLRARACPVRWPAAWYRSKDWWAWWRASRWRSLLSEHPSEAVMGVGLAGAVAESPVEVQCVPQVRVGVLVGAGPAGGTAEQAVGAGLSGQVARALGGGQRDGLGGHAVGPVSSPVKDRRPGPDGDLPGVGIEPRPGGQRDDGQQRWAFGVEPVQRLLVVGEVLGHRAGLRRGHGDRVPGRNPAAGWRCGRCAGSGRVSGGWPAPSGRHRVLACSAA